MAKVGDILKISRADIQDFPGDTINLIMQMQKDGWRAQRSNRNHVMLFGPDGTTRLSASRNADSAKYLGEDLRKYNKANGKEEREPVVVKRVTQKWPCPRPGCPKIFASESKLNAHIGVDHEKLLKCPDCDDTFKDPKTLGRHRGLKHGYVSPRYAARKAQEAKREAKKVLDEVVETHTNDEPEFFPEPKLEETRNFETGVAEPWVIGKINSTGGVISDSHGVYAYGKLNAGVLDSDISLVRKGPDIVGGSIYAQPEVEHVDFLDERDSWTADLEDIYEMTIRDFQTTLKAAGLKMEIRVWKD